MKRENGTIFGIRFIFLLTIAIGILFPHQGKNLYLLYQIAYSLIADQKGGQI